MQQIQSFRFFMSKHGFGLDLSLKLEFPPVIWIRIYYGFVGMRCQPQRAT